MGNGERRWEGRRREEIIDRYKGSGHKLRGDACTFYLLFIIFSKRRWRWLVGVCGCVYVYGVLTKHETVPVLVARQNFSQFPSRFPSQFPVYV